MPTPHSRLLYEMSDDELADAARDRRWPKWASMCRLRLLGLPVLAASCIRPGQSLAELHAAIGDLAFSVKKSRLMLRSDGGIETRRYYRGGNSFLLDDLKLRAAALLKSGRAIILLEPTNRFTNQLSALLRMERSSPSQLGQFTIEALGPGYDVGDLTRGGIPPQVTVTIQGIDWSQYDEPWWADLRVKRNLVPAVERSRRWMRLQRLAVDVLSDTGDLKATDSGAAVEQWLRSRGYLDLWRSCDPTLAVVWRSRLWFDEASLIISAQPNRDWRCLATSLSDLGDGRIVYWDVINGAHKYGTRYA